MKRILGRCFAAARRWVAECHFIVTITVVAALKIANTDEAHLAVAFTIIAEALIKAILANLCVAIAVRAELKLRKNVLIFRAFAILLLRLILGSARGLLLLLLLLVSLLKSWRALSTLFLTHLLVQINNSI